MQKWRFVSKHINLGTSFASRKLHLQGTAPGTHDRWQAGRDKQQNRCPAWNQTLCPSHPVRNSVTILTLLSMLLYRLRKSQHYRQHVNLEQQNTWIYYLICSKYLPPTTHIATSSPTFLHVCTYCLTKTTKLSLFTTFRLLNIRVSGDF